MAWDAIVVTFREAGVLSLGITLVLGWTARLPDKTLWGQLEQFSGLYAVLAIVACLCAAWRLANLDTFARNQRQDT